MDYHDVNEEHIIRYVTSEQHDKPPEDNRPSGAGFHVLVFFVASAIAYFNTLRASRLKSKYLKVPPNGKFIL